MATKQAVQRGPSLSNVAELPPRPSLVPSLFMLAAFTGAYSWLQKGGHISVPSEASLLDSPVVLIPCGLVGVINMFNHIAGYLQPVPMWSLFTGAFIDFFSSLAYLLVFYAIGYTPTWLVLAWVFQMGIHSYYMSTGLSKPDNKAAAFKSLMQHMRRLQTNQKSWWNALFLNFDMAFHAIFLIEVLPHASLGVTAVEALLAYGVYCYLYERAARAPEYKRPKLMTDAKGQLVCPCFTCKGSEPFGKGCAQWFHSIDQLYLDAWGICVPDARGGIRKQTSDMEGRFHLLHSGPVRKFKNAIGLVLASQRFRMHGMA